MMDIDEKLLKIISQTFNVEKNLISLKTGMDDIDGWDSLGHLNLIMSIEKEFKIKFSSEQIINLDSVEKIQNALIKLKAL
jgi:acyl carrier protein